MHAHIVRARMTKIFAMDIYCPTVGLSYMVSLLAFH